MMQSEEKLCVVVLFGGMSSEHEVSCVSAGTFVDNLDPSRYEVLTVGITKEGRWLCTEASSAQMADGSWEELPGNMPCVISPDRADHGMILFAPSGQVEKLHVDVVIPALHGLWGDVEAMQNARQSAATLAEAIGQKIGKCFYIYDSNNDVVPYYGNVFMARSMKAAVANDAAEAAGEAAGLDFKTIKLKYSIQAKFVLE